MKDIVIIGAKGCAKEILFLLEENNRIEKEWNILGFIDYSPTHINGYPVLGDDGWLQNYPKSIHAVCAIGDSTIRKKVISSYRQYSHIKFPKIISRHALVGKDNIIEEGVIICSRVTVTTDVSINEFSIVNIGSTICHESKIGAFATIAPGVNISGGVEIGEGTNVGVGAKVIQNISIGNQVIVGAGAVVVHNLPDCCTAIGVPARIR